MRARSNCFLDIRKAVALGAAYFVCNATFGQGIPSGDSWSVPLSNGSTIKIGGVAQQLCQRPNGDPLQSSRMTFLKSQSVTDNNKIVAETFVIYAPYVKGPVTQVTSQEIPLITGDRVLVYACGCVQTGGSSKTWKTYVHPKGNLYSGTIQFISNGDPSFMANFFKHPVGMQKISDFIGSQGNGFTVPAVATQLFLGYLDDHYSDNGYWSHDDGTGDQCKNVGPAALEVAIFHQQ